MLMAVVALNVWTGSPLLALWVGSRVQGSGPPSMSAIAVVGLMIAGVSGVLVAVLNGLRRTYDRVTGRRPTVSRHTPWLRSMRGERPHEEGDQAQLSLFDGILVGMVMLVVAVFEIWFFFYSGSSIDGRSGR